MSIKPKDRKLNWRKQPVDRRDFKPKQLAAVRKLTAVLPATWNLRQWCSPVEDQGELGSCTSNAWAGILEFDELKYPVAGRNYFDLSRLFVYYNERLLEGTVHEDAGAYLRDGAKAIAQYGVCPELEWKYIASQFAVKPTSKCYTDALPYRIHSYYSLGASTPSQTLINLKTAIASGQPFVFGFIVYDSFISDQMAATGIMPMPNLKTESIQGGHAVLAIGYNDSQQRFLIKNSWGTEWGLPASTYRGYFTMPYQFITNPKMASDFWTVVKEV